MLDGFVIEQGACRTAVGAARACVYARAAGGRSGGLAGAARRACAGRDSRARARCRQNRLASAACFPASVPRYAVAKWWRSRATAAPAKPHSAICCWACCGPMRARSRARRACRARRFKSCTRTRPPRLRPALTLRAALADVLALHGLQWDAVAPLLARLRLGEQLLDRLPSQVSGGELQRFALARVLLLKPALIFADEPTSRLDPITQQETLNLLLEVAGDSGCAVLLVTHDAEIARAVRAETLRWAVAQRRLTSNCSVRREANVRIHSRHLSPSPATPRPGICHARPAPASASRRRPAPAASRSSARPVAAVRSGSQLPWTTPAKCARTRSGVTSRSSNS